VLALDPSFARALDRRAYVEQTAGNNEAALRTLTRCVGVSPDATDCLSRRMDLYADLGQCSAAESDARKVLRLVGNGASANFRLAEALFAQGRAIESVRGALDQAAESFAEAKRARFALATSAGADILVGDFVAADQHLSALEQTAGSLGFLRMFDPPGVARVKVLLETGDLARAAALADDLLKKRGARNDEADARPLLYAIAVRGKRRSEREREEQVAASIADAEAQSEKTATATWRWRIWLDAYAAPAESRAEAEQALRARDSFPAFAASNRYVFQTPEIAEGKMYALVGRYDEAIARLKPWAESCHALSAPFEFTHAWYWLGESFAAKGDTEAACHAYGVVLSRWGHAKPQSVTARAARAKRAALHCPQ
jgi:serine/threonine-protein kinase